MKPALIHLLVTITSKLNIDFAIETKNQTLLQPTEISGINIRKINTINNSFFAVDLRLSQLNPIYIRRPSRLEQQYCLISYLSTVKVQGHLFS